MCYISCKTETVTVRLHRSKSELKAKAKPNINAWVNNLIEQALGPGRADWSEHFARLRKRTPSPYCSDEIRAASR
jgi:hypothetical protein